MQKYCTDLTERLLKSLDKEYNVVDMGAVVDVITALEKTTITKEVLEFTRLGKYINELRRKTSNDVLAKRAKDLVRRWREMLLPSAHSTPQPTPADPAPPALNGAKPHSPSLKGLKPQSPALRGLKPQSPLSRDATHLRVLSPALSVHSDRSHSPRNTTPNKQTITATSNHRLSPGESPKPGHTTQNHSTEAVPRTHSSNKRLRKEDSENARCGMVQGEPFAKRQRLNGENVNSTTHIGLNSQVPSPVSRDDKPPPSLVEVSQVALEVPDGPKKRGRKKGSKSVKKQPHMEDHVKEKLASISRNPKLKTTQELLADLQARGTNSGLTSNATPSQNKKEPPSAEDVLRSSNEHVAKYLQSQSDVLRNAIVDNNRSKINDNGQKSSLKYRDHPGSGEVIQESKSQESRPTSPRELSVEEILAKLPPLDPAAIVWSDQEEDQEDDIAERPPREVLPQDLERLHEEQVEGLNGNYQPRYSETTTMGTTTSKDGNKEVISRSWCSDNINGGQTDREFREWHQMLARPSFNSQTLHILPYVIID